MSTKIEWADETWTFDPGHGLGRWRVYHRLTDDERTRGSVTSPGQSERRRRLAEHGERWCRGCPGWLPAEEVTRQGLCRLCTNAADRARYRADPAPARARVYARRRDLDPIPPWWRAEQIERFQRLCAYGCGRDADGLDHVWPVALGGRSVPGNLVPACVSCNSSKSDQDPTPWVARGMAAFGEEWLQVADLAIEHSTDEWIQMEAVA